MLCSVCFNSHLTTNGETEAWGGDGQDTMVSEMPLYHNVTAILSMSWAEIVLNELPLLRLLQPPVPFPWPPPAMTCNKPTAHYPKRDPYSNTVETQTFHS